MGTSKIIQQEKAVVTKCDGLSVLGPGSGTIRKCGLIGVDVSLWARALLSGGQSSPSSL